MHELRASLKLAAGADQTLIKAGIAEQRERLKALKTEAVTDDKVDKPG